MIYLSMVLITMPTDGMFGNLPPLLYVVPRVTRYPILNIIEEWGNIMF